jgi:hypothetical protein
MHQLRIVLTWKNSFNVKYDLFTSPRTLKQPLILLTTPQTYPSCHSPCLPFEWLPQEPPELDHNTSPSPAGPSSQATFAAPPGIQRCPRPWLIRMACSVAELQVAREMPGVVRLWWYLRFKAAACPRVDRCGCGWKSTLITVRDVDRIDNALLIPSAACSHLRDRLSRMFTAASRNSDAWKKSSTPRKRPSCHMAVTVFVPGDVSNLK